MIYCKVADLSKYSSISKNIKTAIDFIQSHDLNSLPLGKTIVDGENVFINKSEAETKLAELQRYEAHHKYIDIQIDLAGDEKLYVTNYNNICVQEYIAHDDYELYDFSEPDVVVNLNKEFCAIIFSNEIHLPCIKNTTDAVTKCVVKVSDN
jgi:YhcH/YjgK/YiaL family protein